MTRSLSLVLLVTACAAADRLDTLSVSSSIGVAVDALASGTLSVNDTDREWSEGVRGEVYFRAYFPVAEKAYPFVEGSLFGDSQKYHEDDGDLDVDTFGLGITLGGVLSPFSERGSGSVSISLMPYVRFGIGSSDVTVKDLVVGDATIAGEGSSNRLDFGGGADLSATIGRHFEVALGGGVNFWKASNIKAYSTDNITLIVVRDDVDVSGRDVFVRASIGFVF